MDLVLFQIFKTFRDFVCYNAAMHSSDMGNIKNQKAQLNNKIKYGAIIVDLKDLNMLQLKSVNLSQR